MSRTVHVDRRSLTRRAADTQRGGRVRRLIVCALVPIVLALTACTAPGAKLSEYPPGSGGSIALDRTPAGESYAFDDIRMCIEGEGAVTVVAAEPIDPIGGMEVTHFSVLPSDPKGSSHLDGSQQSLTDAGFPSDGPMVVTLRCPADDSAWAEGEGQTVFGFEVSRTDPEAGSMRGVRVTYEANGVRSTIDYPLGIVLCRELYTDDSNTIRNASCDVQPIEVQ